LQAFAALGAGLLAVPVLAGFGQPTPKQMGFQEAFTPVAWTSLDARLRQRHHLRHNALCWCCCM
jgi:hypothetical protein